MSRRSLDLNAGPAPAIGSEVTIDGLSAVAGGHCLARLNGRIVFVHGALPGETVTARITAHGKRGAFLWGEVVSVDVESPGRVTPPCPVVAQCGGCDWQHASLEEQRCIKAAVIVDALKRTGGLDAIAGTPLAQAVLVEAADDGDGFNWRTRMRYATDAAGRIGLRGSRSNEVVEAPFCLLASPPIREAVMAAKHWPDDVHVSAASSSSGDVSVQHQRELHVMTEAVRNRTWRISPDDFWQVHPQAAALLVEVVLGLGSPQPGDRILDLYSGVGLFAAFLGEAVGATGTVTAVEASRESVTAAQTNLADLPQVKHSKASVDKWLASITEPVDLVVLDPPRAGAGADVVRGIASRSPNRIVYVACDPVALARDTKTFASLGYELRQLRAFDIFPMTKHVECVASFERDSLSR